MSSHGSYPGPMRPRLDIKDLTSQVNALFDAGLRQAHDGTFIHVLDHKPVEACWLGAAALVLELELHKLRPHSAESVTAREIEMAVGAPFMYAIDQTHHGNRVFMEIIRANDKLNIPYAVISGYVVEQYNRFVYQGLLGPFREIAHDEENR